MLELIIGFALGGVAFTEKGRELGNKMYDTAIKKVKEVAGKNENDREVKQDD